MNNYTKRFAAIIKENVYQDYTEAEHEEKKVQKELLKENRKRPTKKELKDRIRFS